MDERHDERLAITAFTAYLREQNYASIRLCRGNDPPDYLMTIEDITYAVEVTTITPQIARNRRTPLSDIGFGKMLQRLADFVEAKANSRQPLDALYLFQLDGPHTQFEPSCREIEAAILRFIELNRNAGNLAMYEFASFGDYSLWMGKLQGKAPGVSWSCGHETSGTTENFVFEFNDLVKNVVEKKRGKLSNIPLPKILLLIDQYSMLDACFFSECPICSSPDTSFDSVFVITSDSRVHPLWRAGTAA